MRKRRCGSWVLLLSLELGVLVRTDGSRLTVTVVKRANDIDHTAWLSEAMTLSNVSANCLISRLILHETRLIE